MVSIEQAIKELQKCELLESSRFTPEQLEQEEQDPSSIATTGEIIILLKELKRIWEKQDKSWTVSSLHGNFSLTKNGNEYVLCNKNGEQIDMFFHCD